MKNYILILFTIVLIINLQCKKEVEFEPKDYPYVITLVPDLNSQGATFSAEIKSVGNSPILKYGFVWSDTENPSSSDNLILFEGNATTGIYEYTQNTGLVEGKKYSLRAYIITEQNEIYGNIVSFESIGCLGPKINNFEPKFGSYDTQVIVEGENFAPKPKENEVFFGTVPATVDSVSQSKLYVSVPYFEETKDVLISVSASGYTVSSSEYFNVLFPWTQKSNFPDEIIHRPSSFALNGKIYFCNGKEFWEYNPISNSWIQKPDFPGQYRKNAVAFSCNNTGYYGMGTKNSLSSYDYLTDIWEYNPETESWIQKTIFPGTPVIYSKSFVIGNKAYVGPGYYWEDSWSHYINDVWKYDPNSDNWEQKQDFPGSERYVGMAIGTEDKGYMGLGNKGSAFSDIYEYDPNVDNWDLVGYYPGDGFNGVACLYLNGKLFIGLGSNNSCESYNDFWEFDVENYNWRRMQSCPVGFNPNVFHVVDDKGYVGIGFLQTCHDKGIFYEFDPSKN